MLSLERFFKLEENGTNVSTEILAGITTFFAMSYIIFVNPAILALSGMPSQAVFLATIFASAISTVFIGLFANVPYALGPGMGLNAFFTYTVVFGLGFTWQEALSMVFICGIINVLITITNVRKMLILAIPDFIQHAISAGIGVFIAYLGIKNAGLLTFLADATQIISVNGTAGNQVSAGQGVETILMNGGVLPELANVLDIEILLVIVGLFLTVALMILNVRGAILIGIIATTALAIATGTVDLSSIDFGASNLVNSFKALGETFFVIFKPEGLPSLFRDPTRIPVVIMTIFAFSLSDVFDTIGTFIGTGRRSGIFSDQDIAELEHSSGITSKMDRALFGDSFGTVFGALLGTSNTTTFVESAAGIGAGGRTGLTSVSTAVCFILAMFLSPIIGVVPPQATAPALIVVGVLMLASFAEINWSDFEIAVPAFFGSVFMGLCYSISNGIAAAFITYGVIKIIKGEAKEVHPILWISMGLFILNYIVLGVL